MPFVMQLGISKKFQKEKKESALIHAYLKFERGVLIVQVGMIIRRFYGRKYYRIER